MRRSLLFAVLVDLPGLLHAQSAPTHQPASGVVLEFEQFVDNYGSRLTAAFDSIPGDRFSYRPTPSQQTIGYIAQHLENANYVLCEQLGRQEHIRTAKDSLPDTVKAQWPKDTLVARLGASLRFCDAALDGLPRINSADIVVSLLNLETDLAEHYSQISVYMRLLGMTPPSALPRVTRTVIALPASALKPYVGVYELARGLQLIVTIRDGELFIRSVPRGATVRLWPEATNRFFTKEVDAEVTFTRGLHGDVTGLEFREYGRQREGRRLP